MTDEEIFFRYTNKKPVRLPARKPNYNLSPTQDALVLHRDEEGALVFENFRWGLVPSWAKDVKVGHKMINARAETIAEKPSFRNAFKKRRCIVPLSGFIEWKRDNEAKRPFCIHLKNEPIMSLAGIWETWNGPESKKPLHTFSLITTAANTFMDKIHDRMPVILDESDEELWLDSAAKEDELVKLLKPCPSKWLEAYEVSTAINSPKNNAAEILQPPPPPRQLKLL